MSWSASVSRLFASASSSSSQPLVSRWGLPNTWSRDTSSFAAKSRRTGTEGRNTLAVSPGRLERTNRPMTWAKNSGVDADVAYTPTASRGTSTPSDTMRTATIHSSVLPANFSIRSEAPASSDSTTDTGVVDSFSRILA